MDDRLPQILDAIREAAALDRQQLAVHIASCDGRYNALLKAQQQTTKLLWLLLYGIIAIGLTELGRQVWPALNAILSGHPL